MGIKASFWICCWLHLFIWIQKKTKFNYLFGPGEWGLGSYGVLCMECLDCSCI